VVFLDGTGVTGYQLTRNEFRTDDIHDLGRQRPHHDDKQPARSPCLETTLETIHDAAPAYENMIQDYYVGHKPFAP